MMSDNFLLRRSKNYFRFIPLHVRALNSASQNEMRACHTTAFSRKYDKL